MNFDEKEEEIKTKGTMYAVTTLTVLGAFIAFFLLGVLFVWGVFFKPPKYGLESVENMNVIIDNKKYNVVLEDNETVKEFLNLLPQEFTMEELNGNEKYVYLDESLSINASIPNHILAGDIMLYGKNCIVIFYQSFDTGYSYTKIGHIVNLPDLGNGSILVQFEK